MEGQHGSKATTIYHLAFPAGFLSIQHAVFNDFSASATCMVFQWGFNMLVPGLSFRVLGCKLTIFRALDFDALGF